LRDAVLREHRSFAIEDLIVDTELLERARSASYATKVIFISTEDPKLNVGRILIRMSRGGQSVPVKAVPESYEESMKSLPQARKHADDLKYAFPAERSNLPEVFQLRMQRHL